MEHQFLKDVNKERDDWSVRVRVIRMWHAFSTKTDHEPLFREMILLDEQETPLHAVVRKHLIQNFKDIIQEGTVYSITNLKIEAANETYRPVKGSLKALFLTTTVISKIKGSTVLIPQHYFDFVSQQTLSERVGETIILSDIIGVLQAMGNEEEVQVYGKPTKIRRLQLKLKENEIVNVTLWRNIASEFDKIKLTKGETTTIAITSTVVKKFRDEYSLNSTSSTRLYINLHIPEFQQMTQGSTSQDHEIREIPSQDFANNTPEKRMVRNRTTLQNIISMKWESKEQEKVFTIEATINGIDDTFGWHYIGCEICMKKLTHDGQQYMCCSCKKPSKYPTPRFKIQLQVSDNTAESTLTLFDGDAKKLLNTTASQLLEHTSSGAIPSTLQNLCHRTIIFEIKLTDHNLKEGVQNYTVTRAFVPNNILQHHDLQRTIKQEPESPQPTSSKQHEEAEEKEENGKVEDKQHEEAKDKEENGKLEVNKEYPISRNEKKKQSNHQKVHILSSPEDSNMECYKGKRASKKIQEISSSDEEPILIQSLRKKKSTPKKLRTNNTASKTKSAKRKL